MENGNQPAFARPAFSYGMGEFHAEQIGLTKREYFAAMALQGLCAIPSTRGSNADHAAVAVSMADELLKALETNQTKQ